MHALFFLFLPVINKTAAAQAFLGSARQNPDKSWRATAYYRDVSGQRLAFGVPAGPGTTNDVPGTVAGEFSGLKLAYQPGADVEYFLTAGGGHYTLDAASSTLTNHLSGERVGWELGAGLKALIEPETPVTPAVSVTASAGRSSTDLNALEQAGQMTSVSQRLTLDRYELALTGSKRFGRLEPYGGVALFRIRSKLKDLDAGSRNGGDVDGTRVVIGLKVAVFSKEAVEVEARLGGGTVIGAGWEVRFD